MLRQLSGIKRNNRITGRQKMHLHFLLTVCVLTTIMWVLMVIKYSSHTKQTGNTLSSQILTEKTEFKNHTKQLVKHTNKSAALPCRLMQFLQ